MNFRLGRNPSALVVLVPLLVALGACASTTTRPPGGTPDKLTQAEIAESGASSAYDVVTRLRPAWLSPARLTMSGARAGTQTLLVYLDGVRFGGVETLRTLSASQITSMEFLTATRAASEVRDVGTSPVGPVIMVRTR